MTNLEQITSSLQDKFAETAKLSEEQTPDRYEVYESYAEAMVRTFIPMIENGTLAHDLLPTAKKYLSEWLTDITASKAPKEYERFRIAAIRDIELALRTIDDFTTSFASQLEIET